MCQKFDPLTFVDAAREHVEARGGVHEINLL